MKLKIGDEVKCSTEVLKIFPQYENQTGKITKINNSSFYSVTIKWKNKIQPRNVYWYLGEIIKIDFEWDDENNET